MKIKIIVAVLLIVSFSSCKKDSTARQTQYNIIPQNSSGVTGTVTFIEQPSLSQTEVDIEVKNTPGYYYVAHIHQGTPSLYRGAIYIFDPIYSSSGHISFQQNIPLLYDSALTLNGTFVLHDSTGNNVLGLCGIGVNK